MNETCSACGCDLVMIRGRYPNDNKRKVCPTCLKERMDQIKQLADPSYGIAYTDKESPDE